MLKKTIAYTDYNGTTRKEDFYFNLTQAEVTELEVSVEGGLVEMINRIVAAQNGKVIMVFAAVVLAFMVAYAAMFGFDKLKEALGQIHK